MDSGNGRMSMNLERDRLSILPDDLIHKILSFISIKHAVKTSVLSSRWRFIWTSMPYLNFVTEDFYTLREFSKFVTHFLSCRNNEIEVFSVKLRFRGGVSQGFFKSIMDYAFSPNVQRLIVAYLPTYYINVEFPLSLLSSQSLKHLTLGGPPNYNLMRLTSTWELPALTGLHLYYVIIFDYKNDNDINIFSKCANLMNLTLHECQVWGRLGLEVINIFHPLIFNLRLSNVKCISCAVNLVAPQLKNLTIINGTPKYQISAPRLVSFIFKGSCYESSLFFEDGLHCLEKAHLCIYGSDRNPSFAFGLLKMLYNVKILSLNLEIIQALSSSVELFSQEPFPFVNLKSLKIYRYSLYYFKFLDRKVNMSTEVINYSKVINYLLDGSPSTNLTVISHKDIRADMNVTSAHNLMSKLLGLLEQKKLILKPAGFMWIMGNHLRKALRQTICKIVLQVTTSQSSHSRCFSRRLMWKAT